MLPFDFIVQPVLHTQQIHISDFNSTQISLTITQSRDEEFTYDVTYSSPWTTLQHISSNHSSITLSHLNPYTDYNITVKCKTLVSPYWSEVVHKQHKTFPSGKLRRVKYLNSKFIELKICKTNM